MAASLFKEWDRIEWSPELIGILTVYFAQGAMGLARLAVSFYFKDQLGLSPSQVAALTGIIIFPWTIKPLYGWLSDCLPIRGYRRRPYLFFSGILGCLAWLAMAFWVDSAVTATIAVTLSSLAVAIGDVIVDSLVVERTRQQAWAATGSLQSLSWGATALGSLITAYFGGMLLQQYPPQVIFGLTAIVPLVVAGVAIWIRETPVEPNEGWDPSRLQLGLVWQTLKQPSVLLPILFVFLWQATPSSETAFFYFVTNDLGFGPEFLGQVRLATSIASLIGVFIFQTYLRTIPLRPLFSVITLLTAALGMTSLILITHTNRLWGIDDHWFSLGDSVILTVAGQIAFMPLLVLAARLCPPGIEATLFALLMSVINLAGFVSHELGALLMQYLGVTETEFAALGILVLVTNLTTLLPLPLIGWLPKSALGEEVLTDLDPGSLQPQATNNPA